MSDGQLIVLVTLGPLVGLVALFGVPALLAKLRGPSTSQREALDDAEVWTCTGCNAHAWEQHDPWCPNWKRVVAGPDLDWQLDLNRFYRDYDAYRYRLRLPGESPAPAYGEER